ncbi:hypothetical protein B0T20DRAFT_152960 [Sordaria brevicollis]|uniref:Uncharacterized protein n=1 Tax=Sordaria brevicollis TaxID=83679 RepID=A0AAE0PJ63_SORBR|nr:hypothetical protein B0T20DRAFT_152960 [Sordaria brevicollis]
MDPFYEKSSGSNVPPNEERRWVMEQPSVSDAGASSHAHICGWGCEEHGLSNGTEEPLQAESDKNITTGRDDEATYGAVPFYGLGNIKGKAHSSELNALDGTPTPAPRHPKLINAETDTEAVEENGSEDEKGGNGGRGVSERYVELEAHAMKFAKEVFPEIERNLRCRIDIQKGMNEELRARIASFEKCKKYHAELKKLEAELETEQMVTGMLGYSVKEGAEGLDISLDEGTKMAEKYS